MCHLCGESALSARWMAVWRWPARIVATAVWRRFFRVESAHRWPDERSAAPQIRLLLSSMESGKIPLTRASTPEKRPPSVLGPPVCAAMHTPILSQRPTTMRWARGLVRLSGAPHIRAVPPGAEKPCGRSLCDAIVVDTAHLVTPCKARGRANSRRERGRSSRLHTRVAHKAVAGTS